MEIVSLLEYLANKTHYHFNLNEMVPRLPVSLQEAFLAKNSLLLKKQLTDINKLADKNSLVNIQK